MKITTAIAAKVLGITSSRVRQLIKSGLLPAVKAGRDWLIEDEDLGLVKARPRRGRPGRGKPHKESSPSLGPGATKGRG